MFNHKSILYSEELNILGGIAEISFLKETVTIIDAEEQLHTVNIESVVELKEIGEIKNTYIYQNDVVYIEALGGNYEFELTEDGKVTTFLLDKKFNRVKEGIPFEKSRIAEIPCTFVGNALQLRNTKPVVDFNIRVYRSKLDGEIGYVYVGNNKEEETVDIIKVVYVGHHLIEEEDYERITVDYDTFLEMVENGDLIHVQPMELANYVTGLTYGRKATASPEKVTKDIVPLDIEDDEEECCEECCEEEDVCEDCGEYVEDCDCKDSLFD